MSESLDPYRNEGVYDTPEYRAEVIAEYQSLERRRMYIAEMITKVWPLSRAVEMPESGDETERTTG